MSTKFIPKERKEGGKEGGMDGGKLTRATMQSNQKSQSPVAQTAGAEECCTECEWRRLHDAWWPSTQVTASSWTRKNKVLTQTYKIF